MTRNNSALPLLLAFVAIGCSKVPELPDEVDPPGPGPYAVGSTNMAIADEYASLDGEAMHAYLLGIPEGPGQPRFVTDILKHPESVWVTDVRVPDIPDMYGPASGLTLPVVSYITYPTVLSEQTNRYAFPYHDAAYGEFIDMLPPGEAPRFADPGTRYPLIVLSHGASAHGIFDVAHAHNLSSHGYIVAVITYGDDRTLIPDDPNFHMPYLRPLWTKAVIDSLVDSDTFGPHIDADNVGITGHSFGGYTALAIAGGPYQGNTATVSDDRVKAGVIAAPWVGGRYDGEEVFGFGPENAAIDRVDVPIISFFGTNDDVTTAEFILPAMKRLSGPTYVVELVDQPHVFQPGSWEDRNAWELLFYAAYLKQDPDALATIKTARSMKGGNEDIQLFEYQK
ncbi:MAG: hypothetical protein QNJ14_15920 [Woeseiaceae bacterium]|nr:hypothetical protein [Woeseiaceae bacterium]